MLSRGLPPVGRQLSVEVAAARAGRQGRVVTPLLGPTLCPPPVTQAAAVAVGVGARRPAAAVREQMPVLAAQRAEAPRRPLATALEPQRPEPPCPAPTSLLAAVRSSLSTGLSGLPLVAVGLTAMRCHWVRRPLHARRRSRGTRYACGSP